MRVSAITLLLIAFIGFVAAGYLRANASDQNCENVLTLRDSVQHILDVAQAQGDKSDRATTFYTEARKELNKVSC